MDGQEKLAYHHRLRLAALCGEAARLLRAHGWTRRTRKDGCGRMCLSGALRAAVTGDPNADIRSDANIFELESVYHDCFGRYITRDNDAFVISQEDAIARLTILSTYLQAL